VLLLHRHAEHNKNSHVTASSTSTVLTWIIVIKSISDGVPQTVSQDTGVPGTSNAGAHSSDDPLAAKFIQIYQ
jgi:hypothetical protein